MGHYAFLFQHTMNTISTIPVKGTPAEEWQSEAWPNDDVRRETAIHVLRNHFDHISAFERKVCEYYTNAGNGWLDDKPGWHYTMDILVNTYHHEL